MERLIQGYRAFRAQRWPAERETYAELAKGQSPDFLVVACSDSRSDPSIIFSGHPGEMFVIRNVANIVPPYRESAVHHSTDAALAYAALVLKVKTILVMGHAQCGGVAAAIDGKSAQGVPFVAQWIELLSPAIARCAACDDIHTEVERESVRLSLERLMSFPFIAQRVDEGALALEGARFEIAAGRLEVLDKQSREFVRVSDS